MPTTEAQKQCIRRYREKQKLLGKKTTTSQLNCIKRYREKQKLHGIEKSEKYHEGNRRRQQTHYYKNRNYRDVENMGKCLNELFEL